MEPVMEVLTCGEYWTRVWLVQEFILARDVFLLAGSNKLPLPSVARLMSVMALHHSNASRIFQLRHTHKHDHDSLSFAELFEKLRSLACALPRDRLFALTGIVEMENADSLRPPY